MKHYQPNLGIDGISPFSEHQESTRTKITGLSHVTINGLTEQEETPEHNLLQAMFLDLDFCHRLFIRINEQLGGQLFQSIITASALRPKFEFYGWDVFIEDANKEPSAVRRTAVLIEIKTHLDDKYPCVLRDMNQRFDKFVKIRHMRPLTALVIDEFHTDELSLEQVRQVFARSSTTHHLITLQEIMTARGPSPH